MADAVNGPQKLDRGRLERVLFSSSTKLRIAALHDIHYQIEHEGLWSELEDVLEAGS